MPSARLASFAAVVVLGATVPVLASASNAWACGDEPDTAKAAPATTAPATSVSASATASDTAKAPAADTKDPRDFLEGRFLNPMPASVTAGGDPVEFRIEQGNTGTRAIENVEPYVSFYDELEGPDSVLQPQDLKLEISVNGAWQTLQLKPGCDPVLRADFSPFARTLAPGQIATTTFRLSVTAHSNPGQKQVNIYLASPSDTPSTADYPLPILRPGATTPTTPAPKPTTTTPAPAPTTAPTTPAVTTPAPTATPVATPTPTTVPIAASLASTGRGSSTTPLLLGGTALVLLGTGGIVLARRRAGGARH